MPLGPTSPAPAPLAPAQNNTQITYNFTYTWKLKSLKKQDSNALSNIVIQTHWELIGTDEDGNSGTFNGATPFNPNDVDPDNYTEYEDLTEAQVLGWIQGVVNDNPGYKEHINSQIQRQIDEKIRPVVEVSEEFPWG